MKLITAALLFSCSLAACVNSPNFVTSDKQGVALDVFSQPLNQFFIESELFSMNGAELVSMVNAQRGFIGSKEALANFELSIEYWTDPGVNSGVYIRCQDPNAFSSNSCYEVNIADTHRVPESRTGSIVDYAPPTVVIESVEQWTTLTIRADGNHLQVTVNGVQTADIIDDTYSEGFLALQYTGADKLIKFREFKITPL